MQRFNIDFMKYRRFFMVVSIILTLFGLYQLLNFGDNLGIDFAGGTQMQVRFREAPSIQQLREDLEAAGLVNQIQGLGQTGNREILIKTPVVEGSEEGSGAKILEALNSTFNAGMSADQDINQRGTDSIRSMLNNADPDGRIAAGDDDEARLAYYDGIANQIAEARKNLKAIDSWDQLAEAGISETVLSALREGMQIGSFAVLATDNVGPQIGGELRQKGLWAMILSLLGMLAYITYRFELRFGVGALIAVFHDFLVVLGLFAFLGYEFNLPTIAAFLTLVGYSVNDTVVIFDRVRENMRRHRRMPLVDVMNKSINQTLSRTILTSGTTLVAVGCLFFLGGEALKPFAFVLLVGVVVGTYSSIFVASPVALVWERIFGRSDTSRRPSDDPPPASAAAKRAKQAA